MGTFTGGAVGGVVGLCVEVTGIVDVCIGVGIDVGKTVSGGVGAGVVSSHETENNDTKNIVVVDAKAANVIAISKRISRSLKCSD